MAKNFNAKALGLMALMFVFFSTTLSAQVGKSKDVLNPNRASKKDLMAMPHMNAKIVDGIMEEVPFLSMESMNEYLSKFLSADQLKELYVKCFVPINLNTASEEEIFMVPGVGKKMAHEFDEYRPYVKLAQWQRSMSKYVSDEEVARMEQYVFVPINPNTATKEEIMSIPGVGEKIHHEFEEYRPFKNMAHFRRELGKYVDEDELERLERYLTLD